MLSVDKLGESRKSQNMVPGSMPGQSMRDLWCKLRIITDSFPCTWVYPSDYFSTPVTPSHSFISIEVIVSK
jgi:hypothetical protein